MASGPGAPFQRFEVVGTTAHRHEQEGVEWLRATLPDYGPFGAYALFSFETDDRRRYEIDAIVLTSHCLYVLELKSWRGALIEGDVRHLVTSSPTRRREVVDHPLPLLEVKTKSFMARVRRVAAQLGADVAAEMRNLWAEPLVWLTHAESKTALSPDSAALSHVLVGRAALGDALRQAKFPGASDNLSRRTATPATLKALRKVLQHPSFGLNQIVKSPTVLNGTILLTELLEEGDGYQDHRGVPTGVGPERRVRSYLSPKTDRAHAGKLERRVEREAKVLLRLGDHPNIMPFQTFDPLGPLGPALIFLGFPGKALDAFLKEQRDADGRSTLTIDHKLEILRRVADALSFCHREEIVHGALSPEAVLVYRNDDKAKLEVRLTRFALAASDDPTSEGTRLFTRLAGTSAGIYQAPEVALGGRTTIESDLFSFGALAYFVLSEMAPAESSTELTKRLARDQGLLISAVRDDLFPPGVHKDVDAILFEATYQDDPSERTRKLGSPLDLVDRLEEALTQPDEPRGPAEMVAASPLDPDPLLAVKGDVLKGGLVVLSELGSGATARVFKVRQENGEDAALKVPLSESHDERIQREGQVLERLRRTPGIDRIAHLVAKLELAGKTCLLVQFAGDRTLAEEIRSEGTISLDYARRWGDDLLTALRSLEAAGVQHRDIKPANIGLTSGAEKGKKRLLLFDFSLSDSPATDLGIGTPSYRDPGLVARGHWDDAADRWAAAITLHEMFTGVRPAPIPGAIKGLVAVRIESDRVDADVRDGITKFFTKAFQAYAGDRHATAEDMREEFFKALHKVPEQQGHDAEEPVLDAASLKGLGPDARVSDLPLSTRQRNALDRMGVYTLHELAQLPTNRLFAVRGVGSRTTRSLVALSDLVRTHLEISATEAAPSFVRGYAGARVAVDGHEASGGPSRALAGSLLEAGIADSVALASAPQAQVKNLVQRAKKKGATETTKDLTKWLESLVDAEVAPTTLGACVELLAGKPNPKKPAPSKQRIRQYLGLEDLEGFPRHGTMSELARAVHVSAPLISIDMMKARERWTGKSSTASLLGPATPAKPREMLVLERAFEVVSGVLAQSGGVAPLGRVASAIVDAFPSEPDLAADAATRAAEALVRIVTEIDSDDVGGPPGVRLRFRKAIRKETRARRSNHQVLIARDREGFELAEALGKEVDRWVRLDGVIAEATAAERLRDVLGRSTEIDAERAAMAHALPDRALVALAAATSDEARLSARGELYAVGLPAERAVVLSAAALTSSIKRDELRRRVGARYPESAPLPDDPAALEQIAKALSMRFAAESDEFVPREPTLGFGSTEVGSARGTPLQAGPPPSAAAAIPSTPSRPSRVVPVPRERPSSDVAGATAIKVFEDELDRSAREGLFRVLLWRGQRATIDRRLGSGSPNDQWIAEAVAKRIGGELTRLDAALIEAAEQVAVEKKLRGGLDVAIAADARGPDGSSWSRLIDLMQIASKQAFSAILAQTRPRVLLRLGLLARYQLLGEIGALAAAHRSASNEGGSAETKRRPTFVVLPVFPGETALVEVASDVAPRVGAAAGTLLVPLPGVLPHEILEVPSAWLDPHVRGRRTSSSTVVAQR